MEKPSVMKIKNKKMISFLVIFAIAVGNAGSTLYLPAFTSIGLDFQATSFWIKLSLSFYLISYGFSQLIYGPLSDAFGRKINLIIGIFIFGVGSILAALSTNLETFLISRIIQGLGMGTANAVGYALLRDIFEGNDLTKQISLASFFVGMVPIVAPIFGGYITNLYNWRLCFYILGFFALVLITLKHFLLPETNGFLDKNAYKPKNVIKGYFSILKNPVYFNYLSITALSFSCLMVANTILPYLICQTLGYKTEQYGLLTAASSSGYFLGALGSSYLLKFYSKEKMLIHATSILFSSSLLALIFGLFVLNIWVVLIPIFVCLLSIGALIPFAASSALETFSKQIGKSSALLGSCMFLGSSFFSALASSVAQNSQQPMFTILLLISLLIMTSIFSLKSKSERVKNT
jgi:DHA1 family 2-module integral membrane pump EmrD-like MFS transporter